VQRALHLAPLEPTIGKRCILMSARVVDREDFTVVSVEHRDGRVTVDPARLAAGKGSQRADGEHGGPLSSV
jgi:hypothetical protein